MAGVITALSVQKRDRERVNIYLDGEFAFALPAVEAARLRKGQELSDAQITQLKAIDVEAKVYDRAVRFLGYRPRSNAEVRRHLREHEVAEVVADRIIERLQQAGYVDDRAFARFWIESRQQFRPRGERALRDELRQKGVAADIVEELLEQGEIDEETTAYRLVCAKARQWSRLDRRAFWQKGGGFLARRGYAYGIIEPTLRRLWEELHADEALAEGQ